MNLTSEFWGLLFSTVLFVISVILNFIKYRQLKLEFIGHMYKFAAAFTLQTALFTYAIFNLSIKAFQLQIIMFIVVLYFLIRAVDSLLRYDIDPIKFLFLGIFTSGILLQIFNEGAVEIVTLENGDKSIQMATSISLFVIFSSMIQSYFWIKQSLNINKYSSEESKKASRLNLIGAFWVAIFPYIVYFIPLLGISIIPSVTILTVAIGYLIVSISFIIDPNLAGVLRSVSNNIRIKYVDQLEKQLVISDSRFKGILESTGDIVIQSNISGNVIYSNIYGDQLRGMDIFGDSENIAKYLRFQSMKQYEDLKTAVDNKTRLINYKILTTGTDGRTVTYIVNIMPQFTPNRKYTGHVFVARDISEMETISETLRQRNEQLVRSQKIESIGTLASGIAHDFNNILQVLKGSIEVIGFDDGISVDSKEILGEIDKVLLQGKEITSQLLTFTRKQPQDFKAIVLGNEIKSLAEMLKHVLPRNIELEMSFEEDNSKVFMVPSQVQQLILNLVVNSKDAMPDGGKISISTHLELKDDFLSTGMDITNVVLTIKDTGIGMTESVKDKLFDPFYTTKKAGEGTGLGMFIVYSIIKNSFGDIQVESKLGEGTEITIRIPKTQETDPISQIEKITEKQISKLKILVVDDEVPIRKFLNVQLMRHGHKVLEATTGASALNLTHEHDDIDLIILDLVMPKMDGTKFLKEFNSIKNKKQPKIIVITGYAPGDTKISVGKQGVVEILLKPFSGKDIITAIARAINSN